MISGRVENGSASTLKLTKSGTGTWILNGANIYTGSTIVSGGQLIINGTTGFGTTAISSGAILGGSGTIRGSLAVPPGATLRPGGDELPPAHSLIDAFSFYPVGDLGAVPYRTVNVWTGVFNGTVNADIIDEGVNKALVPLCKE